ncbi:coiled-coil alpha-helical rod protein 1 [Clupea harengus]|uniref:Coiled-coil alpha-helical rod protein 1 n=1 Tax=Clupea harengus TaxID=7950 RepID=A0A6P3VLR6_CLUHA|nr:coiled-coil alpha-helical rod protein 1 [Clupea harengus]
MNLRGTGEELTSPADFISTNVGRNIQRNLMPPSHFISSHHSTPASLPGHQLSAGSVTGSRIGHSALSGPQRFSETTVPWTPLSTSMPGDPWLAIAQTNKEILELREENQRLKEKRDRSPSAQHNTHSARCGERGGLESEWRLDLERLRAESERLRGQVETLRDNAVRQREEMREKESTIHRQNHELEELRAEMCRCKAELAQNVLELTQRREEREKLTTQLDKLQRDFSEERNRYLREQEASSKDVQRLTCESQKQSLQAKQETILEASRLREELERAIRTHQSQMEQMSSGHREELDILKRVNSDQQLRMSDVTQEVTSLKGRLQDISTERDVLREQLRQLHQDFEAQGETIQSLRTYIGQLTPERGEQERLTEKIQTLEKEKEALQTSLELVDIRLKSVNDILAIQEKELNDEMNCGSILKGSGKGSRVLAQWRHKVFILLVQLRSKDLNFSGEKNTLHTTICSLEEELERERNQHSLVQHTLQDRQAQLDLQCLHTQTLKQDLARVKEENDRLRQENQSCAKALKDITENVQSCGVLFERNVADLESAQSHLSGLGQRVTFATRRIDTIQGLLMRREALRKVQQTAKPTETLSDRRCIADLQTEVAMLSEERDKLAQELKRTPNLIQSALTDLQDKMDSEVGRLSQALVQSQQEAGDAEASRRESEMERQQGHERRRELEGLLAELREEAQLKQEQTEQESKQKLSEVESRCRTQLRALEAQVNTARREHTKAVVSLRQCERQAERAREQERAAQALQSEHALKEITLLNKQLKDKDRDRNLLLAVVHEQGLMSEYRRLRGAGRRPPQAPDQQPQQQPQRERGEEGQVVQPQAHDALMSVLGDLQVLSAAVMHSSEEGSEEEDEREEGQGDGATRASLLR